VTVTQRQILDSLQIMNQKLCVREPSPYTIW